MVFESLVLRDNLVEQLRTCFCNLVLERKGLVAGRAGYRFGLGLLVTLLDSYPLTATHSGSVLALQTAFQDPSWLFLCRLDSATSPLLK